MSSQKMRAAATTKAETYDLAGMFRGRLPQSFTLALIGEPGTGTTVFSLHYIANSLLEGRKVIVISFDYDPPLLAKYLDSFGFDVHSHIADGRLVVIDGYDILCKKMGISKTYEIENLRSIPSDELIAEFDQQALNKHAPRPGEHVSYVADSFTAMSPFLDVRSAYVVVAEICERIRRGGHTALLVGHEGVLESNFVQAMTRYVDGVIRLQTRVLKKGLTREIFIEKMPVTTTSNPSAEFEISERGIEIKYNHSREEIIIAQDLDVTAKPRTQKANRAKLREGRVSTGIPDFDPMLSGGFPSGAFVCVKGDVGTGTSTFCAQHAWSRLLAGDSVEYNCVDEPPDLVAKRFRSFGWDIDPYIDAKKLDFADAYHLFADIQRVADVGLKGISERRKALDVFMRERRETVYRTFGTTDVSVIVDSFTAMAPYLDLKSSYVLARILADSARRTNHVTLATARSSVVEANLLYACLGAADGLIEMQNVWNRRSLARRMRIRKMVFTPIPLHPIEYTITGKGMKLVSPMKS